MYVETFIIETEELKARPQDEDSRRGIFEAEIFFFSFFVNPLPTLMNEKNSVLPDLINPHEISDSVKGLIPDMRLAREWKLILPTTPPPDLRSG